MNVAARYAGRHVSFSNCESENCVKMEFLLLAGTESERKRNNSSSEPVSVTPAVFLSRLASLSLRFGVSFSVIGSLDVQKENSRVTGNQRTHAQTAELNTVVKLRMLSKLRVDCLSENGTTTNDDQLQGSTATKSRIVISCH